MDTVCMLPQKPMSASRKLAWLLAPAMVLPFAASFLYFVFWSDRPAGQPTYFAIKAFTLVWPLIVLFWMKEKLRIPAKFTARSVIPGILFGLAVVITMGMTMMTPLGTVIEAGGPAVREKASALGFTKNFVLFAVVISIAHSFLEEYYWRWFVYGNFRRIIPGWVAHAAAAAAFSAHHFVVTWQYFTPSMAIFLGICVGVGGLAWSYLYERTGTLSGSWISHLIVDAGIMTIGYHLIHG